MTTMQRFAETSWGWNKEDKTNWVSNVDLTSAMALTGCLEITLFHGISQDPTPSAIFM
jgi:hypothetical protein